MNYAKRADELKETIQEHRRYLHRHAELPYQEHQTTAYLVSKLTDLGILVQTFPDYTGCIAVIRGEKPGRTVLLRADIDALPITEESGVPFASENPGVMHACGHDCHASMLLGAAQMLQESRESLCGTVKLLFQAAEEAFYGARYYWDRGHLNDVNAAMGMHVWPTVESGHLTVQDGYLMAGCDNFVLTIHGKAAHGSRPDEGCDAIVAASSIILNLQTIVSRINTPLNPLVVTIGSIHSGTQFNIISDTAVLEGTVRTYAPETKDVAENAIRNIVSQTAAMYGCTFDLDYDRIEPCVCNADEALNEIARNSARKLYGEDILRPTEKATGSEDFSYLMEKIPSSLFVFLGCYEEESGCVYPVHNPKFRINEAILPVGAAQYAQFAFDYLNETAGGV